MDLVAEMTVINPFDFFVESYAEDYGFRYEPELRQELTPYLEIKEQGPLLQAVAGEGGPQAGDGLSIFWWNSTGT